MITVLTNHNIMYNVAQVAADIVHEYQLTGSAVIHLNHEGPCARSIELYDLLDYICNKYAFDKTKISICTCNALEAHDEYAIEILPQHWIRATKHSIEELGYTTNYFQNKDVTKNLFGCLYNAPTWYRLCLLSHVKFDTASQSLLGCNPTFAERQYNTVSLDAVVENALPELDNVINYIKTNPVPVCGAVTNKPIVGLTLNAPAAFYNEFFVDVVAETYTLGMTFFMTEKTIRPIYALTPFITYGPQGFLSGLRGRYGFKTFGQWWDESYDDCQQYDRIKKIYQVIDYLDTLTSSDRINMYAQMQDTLAHNAHILANLT